MHDDRVQRSQPGLRAIQVTSKAQRHGGQGRHSQAQRGVRRGIHILDANHDGLSLQLDPPFSAAALTELRCAKSSLHVPAELARACTVAAVFFKCSAVAARSVLGSGSSGFGDTDSDFDVWGTIGFPSPSGPGIVRQSGLQGRPCCVHVSGDLWERISNPSNACTERAAGFDD